MYQALRSFCGELGVVRRGALLRDLTDHRAEQLKRRGLIAAVKPLPAAPQEGARGLGPIKPSRRGGRTGAASSSSSSPADQAPKTRPSRKRADAPESSS